MEITVEFLAYLTVIDRVSWVLDWNIIQKFQNCSVFCSCSTIICKPWIWRYYEILVYYVQTFVIFKADKRSDLAFSICTHILFISTDELNKHVKKWWNYLSKTAIIFWLKAIMSWPQITWKMKYQSSSLFCFWLHQAGEW